MQWSAWIMISERGWDIFGTFCLRGKFNETKGQTQSVYYKSKLQGSDFKIKGVSKDQKKNTVC